MSDRQHLPPDDDGRKPAAPPKPSDALRSVISPTVNFKVDGTADIGGTWTTPTTPFGWTAYACAHKHRWQSEDPSTRCPNCGTTTFKEVV